MKKVFLIAFVVICVFALANIALAVRTLRPGQTIEDGHIISISNDLEISNPEIVNPTSTLITTVKITLDEPTYGVAFDRNPVFESDKITLDHIVWEGYELTGIPNTWVGQPNDTDKPVEGKYRATIFFKLADNASISGLENNMDKKNIGVINDAKDLEVVYSKPLYYIKTPNYEVKQPEDVVYLESLAVKVDAPVVGEALPKACTAIDSITNKQANLDIPCKEVNGYTVSWNLSYHPVAQAGTDYILNVRYNLNGAALSDKFTPMVNGKSAKFSQTGNFVTITYTFTTPKEEVKEEVKEKEMINQFSIKIDAPEVGKAPSKKATAVTKGFSIDKVTWTPNDKEFKEGVPYKVNIYVSLDEGKDLRSDYFGLVNGAQAIMPIDYDEDDFYVEYMFPRTETPATWATASKWALDELAKAKETGLIPLVLDKEDFTKSITRKEFAHVAVRLYEKVARKIAEPVKDNPFTDTNDEEILKAYNLGITQGMSATTFEPDTLITREQMATMMTRALAKAGIDTSVDMAYVEKFADDASFGKWYVESIYFMASHDIIKGVGDNKFDPQGQASREASLLISVRSAEAFGYGF